MWVMFTEFAFRRFLLVQIAYQQLFAGARLLTSSSNGSGSWIHALTFANLGLLLPDRVVRVTVRLRLGAKIVSRHICVFDSQRNPDGHHGLSCRRSAGAIMQ